MKRIVNDPLLAFARLVLMFFIVVLGIACAALVIAAAGVAIFQGQVFAQLAAQGQPANGELIIALVLLLSAAAAVVGLAIYLLLLLRRIVLSVSEGDPFVPSNADRLARMAWVTLIGEAASVAVAALAVWVQKIAPGLSQNLSVDINFGGGGLLLILVLFILARVFRKGAEMRAELEGTV